MILRFQREHRKKMRHLSVYNLADDEDDLFALTHDGKPIIEDDYEVLNRSLNIKDREKEEEDHQLNKDIVQTLYFGGDEQGKNQQIDNRKYNKFLMIVICIDMVEFKSYLQRISYLCCLLDTLF